MRFYYRALPALVALIGCRPSPKPPPLAGAVDTASVLAAVLDSLRDYHGGPMPHYALSCLHPTIGQRSGKRSALAPEAYAILARSERFEGVVSCSAYPDSSVGKPVLLYQFYGPDLSATPDSLTMIVRQVIWWPEGAQKRGMPGWFGEMKYQVVRRHGRWLVVAVIPGLIV
jgi:hypothetical protein